MNKEDKIEISRTNALKAYNSAKGEVKRALKDLIGSDVLENPKNIVKNFNDVLRINDLTHSEWENKIYYLEKEEIALLKFRLILKAINGDWKADFKDHNQYKYLLYFIKNGLVWSVGSYGSLLALSGLPGCFYFSSKESAYYVWEQFNEEFIDYLNAQ